MLLFRLILPCLLMMFQPLKAKVEAPNYHFSIDEFNPYLPNQSIEPASGQFQTLRKTATTLLLQTEIKQERYQIPLFITAEKNIIIDMYAKLPSYFLHDVFFESLRKKYGKQTDYKKKDEHAIYTWEREDISITYSAACTITCFPIFLSIASQQNKKKSLLQQLKF